MAKEVYITSKDLIHTLNITSQELITVEKFFDSIPDDEWELEEGKDYKIVAGNGLREYTTSGAYTIARYLEATRKQSFWKKLKERLLHTQRNVRRAFIRKKILDNCSSLVKRNNYFFISKADVIAIFGTNSAYLSKMAEAVKRTERPLIQGVDYEDFIDAGGLYYSLPGIEKLAEAFNGSLTRKNRRDWCQDVGQEIQPQVLEIVKQILKREESVCRTMAKVKRQNKKCRVTGEQPDRINNFKLAAHHLYSQNAYPHLANVEHNLIVIRSEVHEQFHHHFMGGNHKSCTIEHFIDFVQKYYPDESKVVLWLEAQKQILGNQQPVDQRKPHVLYLPASRIQ